MTDKNSAKVIPLKGNKCPICGKSATLEMRPFCSKRCSDLDLAKWLDGDYRVPTDEAPTDADFAEADDDERHG